MTLPSILAIAGSIALLVGLLGGGLKAKEVELPKISQRTRVISGVVGAGLIAIALQLFTADPHNPAVNPPPTVLPVATSTPAPTSAPLNGSPPRLRSVVIREDKTKNSLVLYQEIAYTDPDGDAETIDWILVSSSKAGETVSDGMISDSVQQQQAGSTFTGVWTCTGGEYQVTIRVIVSDKAGNRSEPLVYNLSCR